MFVSATLIGYNYLSIRLVLILNPLLMYIDLIFPIEIMIRFGFLLLIHSMVANFILRLMVTKKGIM